MRKHSYVRTTLTGFELASIDDATFYNEEWKAKSAMKSLRLDKSICEVVKHG